MHILFPGTIQNCVIAYNQGGRAADSAEGGGISVEINEGGSLVLSRNIIAYNSVYGMACWDNSTHITAQYNIFWNNDPSALIVGPATSSRNGVIDCDGSWISNAIVADPQFCDPEHDDFRVRPDSPAMMLNDGTVIGILGSPGCDTPSGSPTLPLTALSPRYR